jgi:hypothetical protein
MKKQVLTIERDDDGLRLMAPGMAALDIVALATYALTVARILVVKEVLRVIRKDEGSLVRGEKGSL